MNDLKYYMGLNYPIEVVRISTEDETGYEARIPFLGKFAFRAYGDSVDEAIENLEEVKAILFEKYIQEGIAIPEPHEEQKEYSGKFLLRVPTDLHEFLVSEAKKNGTTLNQYCNYILTRKSYLNSIKDEVNCIRSEIKDVFSRINEINYKIEHPYDKTYNLKVAWGDEKYNRSA